MFYGCRIAYSNCGNPEGLVLKLLVPQLVGLGLRERKVESHARLPHARLHHEVAPLLQQLQLEVGPEAVLVEGDLTRLESVQQTRSGSQYAFRHFNWQNEMQIRVQMRRTVTPH